MATIRDVAKVAGVSPSTVSRAIAGSDRISNQTKEKVRRAMKEVDYFPNAIARSLARANTRTVGFTVSRKADQAFSNPFFPEVLRGMSSVVQRRDYNILLSISIDEQEERQKCLQLIRERRVDGLIVSTSRVGDELISALVEEKTPFVVIGRSADFAALAVNNDNVDASYQATQHLLDQGYGSIAFISGPRDLVVTLDRLQGYKRALMARKIPMVPERIVEAEFSEESGFEALCRLQEQGVEFDAVLASDDLIALGALRYARHANLSVPRELGIVGFNDTPLMTHTHPPLTSVRILSYELGVEAMELLLDRLETPERVGEKKEVVLPSHLVVRESTRRSQGNGPVEKGYNRSREDSGCSKDDFNR